MSESSSDRVGPGNRLEAPRPKVLASITDQHVLAAVGDVRQPISRAEIAEVTGLSKPAVSTAAARLLERGVLRNVGVREGRRGGVATLFELNPHHGRSLAIVIQGDAIAVQVQDLHGVVRADLEAAVSSECRPEEIIGMTNRLIADAKGAFEAPLLAAAVSIADPVDAASGEPVVLDRSVFPAAAISPSSDLALSDAARIVVDNDVNWATVGEYQHGVLRGCDDFVYVYIGQGLGAGLMLDGRLFRGHRGFAGEVGYLRDGSDPEMDITQKFASLGLGTTDRYGIDVARASSLLGTSPLSDAANAAADVIAIAVANVAIVVNPSAIAFGGPLSAFPAFTDALKERISSLTIDPAQFVISETTPMSGAGLEAHRLALEEAGLPQSRKKLLE